MRNLKRALSLTLASVMLLGMMVVGASAAGFPDVEDTHNVEAIEVLKAVDVMVGDDKGNFGPDQQVSRAQMAVVMAKLLNLDYNYYQGQCKFTDVPNWAAPYVAACYANGIVSGYNDTTYGANDDVTAVQAASMMMRALGYFKYKEDYQPTFELATVKQASEIGIFSQVKADAKTPLTRNQVAQMALNALRTEMVTFTGTPGFEANGVTVGYRAEYTLRTSTEAKYNAIEGRTSDVASDANHKGQYYIQLGEQLYDGDLRLNNRATDDFGRPSRYWEYDGKAIGTYMKKELIRQEYTNEVTGKDLYDLLGADTIKEYSFDITIDGVAIDAKTGDTVNNTVLKDNAKSYFDENNMVKTNKTKVGQTGKGVLTQVFVNPNTEEVDIAVINTYLAKASADYSEKRDEVKLNVYGLTNNGASGSSTVWFKETGDCSDKDGNSKGISVSSEDFDVADMKKDEIVLVTQANGEIKTLVEPEVIAEATLSAFSKDSYVINDGTQYDYNTTIEYDPDTLDSYTTSGSATQQLKNTSYNLYLDRYGYLIGVEEVESTKNYIFLTGIDQGNSNLNVKTSEAAGILLDGTFINFKMNMTDSKRADDTKFTGHALHNTWCTYTEGKDGTYTLKEVGNYAATQTAKPAKAGQYSDFASNDKTIDTKRVSLYGAADKYVYGNDNSIYILAETKEVAAKNEIADDFPVPGDGSAGTTGAVTAVNKPVVIISGVDSMGTGIDNVSIKTFENVAAFQNVANDGSAMSRNTVAFPGWIYTLFDNDGYVIAAVVVGEDEGTNKNLVYSNKDAVKRESYSSADDEWTWVREVIYNGEAIDLTEKGSGLSKLEDMTENTWYEVTYKADGTVKDVKHAYFTESGKKVGNTKASDATLTLSHNTNTDAANFVKHIEYLEDSVVDSNKSTILYEEVWGEVTTRNEADTANVVNKYGNAGTGYGDGDDKDKMGEDNAPSLKGSTLYVDTNAKMGFYVHKDVKSVLIQKNDGKSTTTFGTGTADLEDMLEDLNYKSGTYLFKISAILVDGRATVVVIHDWNEGDAGQGDKDRDPADNTGKVEIYVNFYDDVENKTGTYDEEIIYKAASSTGRLTLTAADLAEKLPAGKVVDTDVTKLPLTLEVKGENGGYAEADIQVTDAPATTRNVKLPVGYKISYGATPTEVTFDATTAASGVDVPNDAAITVTVPATVDTWYVLDPSKTADTATTTDYKSAGGTFTIAAGAADVNHTTALAEKYYKVSAAALGTAVDGGDGISYNINAVTAVYKKVGEDITVTVTGTGSATTGNGANKTLSAANVDGMSFTVSGGGTITQPTTAGGAYSDTDFTVTLGEATAGTAPTAKDIAIVFAIA